MSDRRKLVLLGMMSKIPVAGVVWQTMHYVVGFGRLGFDVYYVEAHARTPSMFMEHEQDDGSGRAAAFIDRLMRRFDLGGRWAFHALHDDGRVYGISEGQLRELYRSADLIVNLHGGTAPLPEHYATDRLVYVETDPVALQLELYASSDETIEFLEPHCAFFTFAENYGNDDCLLPVSDRFDLRPTRQPVVLDFWRDRAASGASFTTVGNWKQPWRDVYFEGETYSWSKHREFAKFLDLPARTGQEFELALAGCEGEERQLLEEHGWRVLPAEDVSADIDSYSDYVSRSRAEFTVAKDQNVRLRTGWFSDRSATYLAASRPVVTQDTGFGNVVPTGQGLFAFSTLDDAAAAVAAITGEYERHRVAAADVAREYFDDRVVLGALLDEVGLERIRGRSIIPVSKRPTILESETVGAVLSRPVPRLASPPGEEPWASVVVVTFNGLLFTRLCLESVLAHTDGEYELIVVDNGSNDDTPAYLEELAQGNPRVRLILNEGNLGFAAANNQGLEAARGRMLVLLNNDTIVTPGSLGRLHAHLADEKVGAVGPVTNRSNTEAQIDASYRTYGEMLRFAAERARENAGEPREVGMLTMFCFALRRDVFERIGPLDTQFEIGLLEDDDYVRRLRDAGYRLVCAEDVFVHHFGEASFGKLVADGEYRRILDENKARYEAKWGEPWRPYDRRRDSAYAQLVLQVRDAVRAATPVDATVLVATRGDEELVALGDRRGWHFPQTDRGVYAGHYPAESSEAIRHLEELRAQGAEFLVVPSTSAWWLKFYADFGRHLETRYRRLGGNGSCAIFDLRDAQRDLAEAAA